MNLSLVDPFQIDLPEVIEEYLEHGIAKCISFNRRGTLLAAGCADGSCVIWDFYTRGVSKEFRDNDCNSPVATVSWSKCGHHLLAATTDKCISCWDVAKGVKLASITLPQTALHAQLHPGVSRPMICVVCPMQQSVPLLVDFSTGDQHPLPISASDGAGQAGRGKEGFSPCAASFNKKGDLIYVGNSKGEILVIDTETRQVRRMVKVNDSPIRHIVFSRSGSYLLTISGDRVIRVFDNLLPRKNPAAAVLDSSIGEVLKQTKEFQDAVNRPHWKTACFSNDAELVAGGTKGEHKIHLWNRQFGQHARTLEGVKGNIIDMAWHPTRLLLASVSMAGSIYLWAKDHTENWSAFAPDFRELEENEEYVEREDEFDQNAEMEKAKPVQVEEDMEVDVTTMEKIAAFSDSDESEDNLIFLPSIPQRDSPEPVVGEPQPASPVAKVQNSNPSESNDSEETNPVELPATVQQQQINSSPEEEVAANGRTRRKRRLSEKAAELKAAEDKAELGRKSKNKAGRGKMAKNNGDGNDSEETLDDLPSPEAPSSRKSSKRHQKVKHVSSLPREQ